MTTTLQDIAGSDQGKLVYTSTAMINVAQKGIALERWYINRVSIMDASSMMIANCLIVARSC